MFSIRYKLTRRASFAIFAATVTASAAGAAGIHRMSISQTTGSEGAQAVFQNSATGGALQGEVGTTSANTSIRIPFGLLGEYDHSGSTFGIGVAGISTTGYAVAGEALGNQPSVIGVAGGSGIGVEGTTPVGSSAAAVFAEANGNGSGGEFFAEGSGLGLLAEADGTNDGLDSYAFSNSVGAYAYSSSGYGVEAFSGTTDGFHADIANGSSGVAGINEGTGFGTFGYNSYNTATPAPTAAPFAQAGVFGQSKVGTGVYGVSLECCTPAGYDTQRYAGVFGFGNSGPGVQGYSYQDIGVYAQNDNTQYPTIFAENEAGTLANGISLYAFNDQTDRVTIAYSTGNFYTDGSITSGTDTYQAVTRNPGTDLTTYSAQHTVATVEDFGTAQLVNGTATVPLAADFRQTINQGAPYMVFLTPDGDNHGLYIASRSPAGFTVRENQSGRSTLAFDYRIVAQPYGTPHARLPHFASLGFRKPAIPKMANGRNRAAFDGGILLAPNARNRGNRSPAAVRAGLVAQRLRGAPPVQPLVAPASLHR